MRPLSLLLLAVLAASPAGAASQALPAGLPDALAARSMLGADTWCRLVRIENTAPRGLLHRHDYPKVVYAALFELSGILWFYTPTDGTQSLSLTTNTVPADEANPGPLLRALYPGFTKWTWVDERAPARSLLPLVPANGCFVESVSCALRRMATGAEMDSPRLLSYYVDTAQGRLGHTVVVFGTSHGLAAVDPGVSPRPVDIPSDVGDTPMAISAYLRGERVSAARTLPLNCRRDGPPLLAQASLGPPGTG